MSFYRSTCIIAAMLTMAWTGIAFSAPPDSSVVIAGGFNSPSGVATDSSGNSYVADTGSNKVVVMDSLGVVINTIGSGAGGYAGDNSPAGLTTQLNGPTGLAVDINGNLYIADTLNHRIRKVTAIGGVITPASVITTVAGNGVEGFSGDGALAISASLKYPMGVAVDGNGNLYIADSLNYRVRKVEWDKTAKIYKNISTVAGDGKATTLTASGIAVVPFTSGATSLPVGAGNLYIADPGNNRIRMIAAVNGVVDGKIAPVTVAGSGTAGYSGDGGRATQAQLNQPSGVATDGVDVYIADTLNNCVRKYSIATGAIATRAGSAPEAAINVVYSTPVGIALDAAGNQYVADTGNNAVVEMFASVSAVTTASPLGGTYITNQNITLTANKAATITYTIDGTNPLTSGTKTTYTAPIPIASNTILKFASVDVAGNNEVITTATYVFDNTAPVTTPAPAGGAFYSAQATLAIDLNTTKSATIYYTTDGKTPTTASPVYTSPISIPVTATPTMTNLQFFAVDAPGNREIVQSQKYLVAALATTPSSAGGAYPRPLTISLAANDPAATIYYTTDGSDPTIASPSYAAPIPVNAATTLKYFANNVSGSETVKTQVYTIDVVTPSTAAFPLGGSYNAAQAVSLTASEPAVTIYYSTNGTAPTTTSAKYSGPIAINSTTTLMYFAMDLAGNREATKTQVYNIDTVAPTTTASLSTGTYASIQTVKLTTSDPTAVIHYTTDSSTPSTTSPVYISPLAISKTTTLNYFAVDQVGNAESVKSQTYTIITLATTASPAGGTFASAQTVSLDVNESGATIYYTLDGTPPTTASKKYTTPFLINETTTPSSSTTVLQYFAMDKAGVMEGVKTQRYTVDIVMPSTAAACDAAANIITLTTTDPSDATPKIQYIANTDTDNGAAVLPYTLADYTAPITFSGNTIIKFFATDAAGNTELIKTAYCADISTPSPNPSIYLETLPDTAATSSAKIYVSGNVAPFATTTLTLNGASVSTNTTDGSFLYPLDMPLAGNVLTAVATNGINSTSIPRGITVGAIAATTAIGTSNGVVGYLARVPITLTSGYQAAAISVDIDYDSAKLSNPTVELTPAVKALDKTISANIALSGVFRLLIMDKPGNAFTPLPDGTIAYVTFDVVSGAGTSDPLADTTVPSNRATDLGAATMIVTPTDGAVNIAAAPGDSNQDGATSLTEVLAALNMLLDPVTYAPDGAVDLNADGMVSISELQRVINSFLGL